MLPIVCYFLHFHLKQRAFVLFTRSIDKEGIRLTNSTICNLQVVYKLQVLNLIRKRLASNKDIFIGKRRRGLEEEVKFLNEKI